MYFCVTPAVCQVSDAWSVSAVRDVEAGVANVYVIENMSRIYSHFSRFWSNVGKGVKDVS